MTDQPPIEHRIREALRQVDDPEVGINIVDLGLVYGIDATPDRVTVRLTMTSPSCPLGEQIVDRAYEAVRGVVDDNGGAVDIELVWDPTWRPEMMSLSARRQLGWSIDDS
jgi:metal-sulfur cluster biosynthetic enzyme